MLENNIEEFFRKEVEKIKGKAYKFSSPGNNGVPDRLVLYNSRAYFVELKKPGAELRPLQRIVRKRFKELGFYVYVIDSLEKVGDFIDEIQST